MTRASTADCTSASATVGSTSERMAATGSDQPENPPGGSQRSLTANSITSRIDSQKAGTAMPIWLRNITPQSPILPWRAAAPMPKLSAMTRVRTIPATASETVIGRRSPISVDTGTRKEWLMPKSLCNAFHTHEV